MAWSKHLNFLHLSWKKLWASPKTGCYFFRLGSQPPKICKKANSASFPAARLVFNRSGFANSLKLNGNRKLRLCTSRKCEPYERREGQQLVSIATLRRTNSKEANFRNSQCWQTDSWPQVFDKYFLTFAAWRSAGLSWAQTLHWWFQSW